MSLGKIKTSNVVIWSATACITVLVIATIFWPYIISAWNSVFGPGPGEEKKYVYSGNLQITLNTYNLYNDSVLNPHDSVKISVFHADGSTVFGTATGLDGTDVISGQVFESDNGILYLAIDHGSGNTEYFLTEKTDAVNAYLTALPPRDVDNDGILERYFMLDVSWLPPLQAGETQKTITLNLYAMQADVSGVSWSATLNPSASGLSGTEYIGLEATGYMTGVFEGCGFKVVKIELTLPDAGNVTYIEMAKVKNIRLTLGGESFYNLGSLLDSAGKRIVVWQAQDVAQEIYGKQYFYAKNAGTMWLQYSLYIQGANFASSAKWNPTLKLTIIDPAGTISTVTQSITFTDT